MNANPEAFARRALLPAMVVLSGWILWNHLRMSAQPLLADETDFLNALVDWPRQATRITHPPGYLLLLRAALAHHGALPAFARLPGLLSALMTLWLMPVLASALLPTNASIDRARLLAVLGFALSPLTVQNSVLVDIDNTVMAPLLIGCFLLWQARARQSPIVVATTLGAALAITAWFKFPPPILLVGALFLCAVAARDRAGIRTAMAASLFGFAMVAIALVAFSRATGYPLTGLALILRKSSDAADPRLLLARAPQTAGLFALWLGIPTCTLALLAYARQMRESLRRSAQGNHARAESMMFMLVVTVFYTFAIAPAYGFPKYQAIGEPFLYATLAVYVAQDFTASIPVAALLAVAALAFAAQFLSGDTLLPVYRATYSSNLADLRTRAMAAAMPFTFTAAMSLFAVLAGSTLARVRRIATAPAVAACLMAAALGAGAALLARQAAAPYSTRYEYGADLRALRETAKRLADRVSPGERVLGPKDVLYLADRHGQVVSDMLWPGRSADTLRLAVRSRRFAALVWTTKEESRCAGLLADPALRAVLAADLEREQCGDWILWLPRRGGPAQR